MHKPRFYVNDAGLTCRSAHPLCLFRVPNHMFAAVTKPTGIIAVWKAKYYLLDSDLSRTFKCRPRHKQSFWWKWAEGQLNPPPHTCTQYHNNEKRMMLVGACCGGFPATEPQDWGVRSWVKSGSWAGVPICFRNYWKLISSQYDTSSFWSVNEFQPKLQRQNISKYQSGFPEKREREKGFLLFLELLMAWYAQREEVGI